MRDPLSFVKLKALAFAALFAMSAQAELNVYQIGNSFTWDSAPTEFDGTGSAVGWNNGVHIRTSSTIKEVWEVPNPTPGVSYITINPYGFYGNALANYDWDIVTFQPFGGVTMQQDFNYIKEFINYIETNRPSSNTKYYIYQTWTDNGQYGTWNDQVTNELTTTQTPQREYYQHYMSRLAEDPVLSAYEFGLIPAGQAIYEMQVSAENGELGSLVPTSFYRDSKHMSYDYGRYIAHLTVFATLAKTSPEGIEVPTGHFGAEIYDPANAALLQSMQSMVWDVVTNEPFALIPEPTTLVLFTVAAAGLGLRRRR